jgi:hypothetical protein
LQYEESKTKIILATTTKRRDFESRFERHGGNQKMKAIMKAGICGERSRLEESGQMYNGDTEED